MRTHMTGKQWWLCLDGSMGTYYFRADEVTYDQSELELMNELGEFPRDLVKGYPGEVAWADLVEGYGLIVDDGGTGTDEWNVFTSREEAERALREVLGADNEKYKQRHVYTWTDPDKHGFEVDIWDACRWLHGKNAVWFEFRHNGELIFDGLHGCSPLHSIDGDETVASILTFCGLRPGDTDRDHFAEYSERQLAWCQEWGETLSIYTE